VIWLKDYNTTDKCISTPMCRLSQTKFQKAVKLIHMSCISLILLAIFGMGSSVGIATDYRLDSLGSSPGGDKIFRPSRPALGPTPASCKMGTGSFPVLKCGRGILLTTHPLLVPQSWKSRAIPLPTLWATPGL